MVMAHKQSKSLANGRRPRHLVLINIKSKQYRAYLMPISSGGVCSLKSDCQPKMLFGSLMKTVQQGSTKNTQFVAGR